MIECLKMYKKLNLNRRPVYVRYGSENLKPEPDYCEVLTPSILLHRKSGMDLTYPQKTIGGGLLVLVASAML